MSDNKSKIAAMQLKISSQLQRLPVLIGNEAVNFSKDNFRRQAFSGEAAWKGRHFGGRGAILVGGGDLRRSIRIIEISPNSVTVGSDLPYSAIHNEGGEITVTPKMRKFFWYKFYQASGKIRQNKDGSVSLGNAQTKSLSAEAMKWRALAMKKKGKPIKIPARKFLGQSDRLSAIILKKLKLV